MDADQYIGLVTHLLLTLLMLETDRRAVLIPSPFFYLFLFARAHHSSYRNLFAFFPIDRYGCWLMF